MNRLASPLTDIKPHYDAVVVGSGYGGAIAASRLARMGYSVALLERGIERIPGEFPDDPGEATRAFQATARVGRIGRRDALFDLHVGDDISVLVGCGLGGTSLINANVSIRPDPRVLAAVQWPSVLRAEAADTGDLLEGFERAEAMLQPVPYPDDAAWPVPAKLQAMQQSAEALGTQCQRPPINVRFEEGPNAAGVWQPPCNLCGDCCSGCNVGAKNTTAMNYLPDAVAFGCEIFCETRVRFVEKLADGSWRIAYVVDGAGREKFGDDELSVIADIVVLGAGSLGSTEILLRSREQGLALSPRLGAGFSGNGDVLAFGYNNDQPIHGIGLGSAAIGASSGENGPPPVGPTITGLIDLRSVDPVDAGMIIEEGAIPGGLGSFLPAVMAATAAKLGTDSDDGDWLAERARELTSLVRGPYHGAVDHTQTYLVMSHDGADGKLALVGDRLSIDWPHVGERPGFEAVDANLRKATAANGGTFVPNPIWTDAMDHALVTVHPLGGCTMGEDGSSGVVDADCRVFDPAGGVHDGLYVCDGAVIPRSLGVNPLLTISAVTERAMIRLAEIKNRTLDVGKPALSSPVQTVRPVGLRFTEKMVGELISTDDGRTSPGNFVATITASDAMRLFSDRDYACDIFGTVNIAILSPDPLSVSGGMFKLFSGGGTDGSARLMEYRMPMLSSDGRRYSFEGRKTIRDDPGLDVWNDTSTLAVEIREGDTPDGRLLLQGTYRIAPTDFVRQLSTMEVLDAPSTKVKLEIMARFGWLFAGELFSAFAGPAQS